MKKAISILSAFLFLTAFNYNNDNNNSNTNKTENIIIDFNQNKGNAEFDTSNFSSISENISIADAYDTNYTGYMADNFPSSFDLRNSGLIQNVKVQGSYGTCWSQTANDSAESSLIKRNPTIDLSEWHLAYYAYSGGEQIDLKEIHNTEGVFEHGGSALVASNMWSQWIGPVSEKEGLEYGNLDILSDTELQDKYRYASDYHLKNAYLFGFNEDVSNSQNSVIKSFLLKGQAVDVSYNNDSSFYDYNFHSYLSAEKKTATHSVTIIGYDDDFPAENFSDKAKPSKNGAWLAKNSWGNTWNDDGFFWISYEEPSLCEFSVFELEDNNNYSSNYHYDTFITNQRMRAGNTNTSYISNIFHSEGNEWLQAVSFNFAVPNTEYEITVYKNIRSKSNPTDGTKAYTISGVNEITGYQTIEFDKSIEVEDGETFSIVMKLTNDQNPYVITIESAIAVIDSETGENFDLSNHTTYEQIQNYTNENESFYSANARNWTDVTDSYYYYSDAEKETLYNTLVSTFGSDYVSQFDTNFGDDDIVIAQGNIPIKVFSNPVNFVKFSKDSGFIYSDESIELSTGNTNEIFYSINGSDYFPYTDPITITEECTITATTDFETYTEKKYTPAYGTLNRLGYTFSENINAQYATPDIYGNYTIDVEESQEDIILLPISQGNIKINGKDAESYKLTESITLNKGKNIISIEINSENAIPHTVNIVVNRGEANILGDINGDGIVDAGDASDVLAEYANMAANNPSTFDDIQKAAADFNNDGKIDASDASGILAYYAYMASGSN